LAQDAEHKSIRVAPFRPGVKPENWITVAAANTENDKPRWSPDGRTLYFTSLRDGFRCIWAQGLNPITKIPSGEPSDDSFPQRREIDIQRAVVRAGTRGSFRPPGIRSGRATATSG